MKNISLLLFIPAFCFAQTKQDTTELNKYKDLYQAVHKEYQTNDSLQIRRLGVMETLDVLYQDKLKYINSLKKKDEKKKSE